MSELDAKAISLEEGIEKNGEVMVCTSGVSMYPMLRHRKDMVVVEKLTRPLKKYDVPVYRTPSGKVVMHRILKVLPDGYIIRGDNLFHKEYDVKDENILGVLKAFYRDGKYFDCATNRIYKIYIRVNRWTYFLRKAWKNIVRPVLSKVKRTLLKLLRRSK